MNNTTAFHPPRHAVPGWAFNVLGTYVLCIGLCNLIGNTFVLLVSYYRRKKIKPPEVFTINLAVSDLMLLLCAYPWMVASSFNHGWLFGDAGCISYAFFRFMLGLVNIANITALALVRYLKVCRSKQVTDMSWTSAWLSLAGTWLFGAFWALMPVCGWSRYTREPFDVACTLDYKTAQDSREGAAFMMTLFAFCYFIPVAIITFCYICIVRTVRSSRQSLNCSNSSTDDKRGAEKKLTKIAVMVGVGFILAWTPYSLVSLYATFGDLPSLPVILSILPSMFAKSASIYNPIIYFFMNDSFRRDVTAMIKFSIPKPGSTTGSQSAWEKTPTGRHLTSPQRLMMSEMGSSKRSDSPAKTTTTALVTQVDGHEAPSTWV
ncbi:PREDICTED: opsin-5-like isoform X2 [Branchiostoma belcheri]|uniref:Neuropsin n=1 Tax=Branchiostoma belcheri TaxID=7741 RepID=A0A455ZBB2_BRABE|nr:PREDICTED: opsin-5-like isoform X2 [Branchiostoma belcheri]DAC74071.1 TPA_exp: neuropsin [Branchiostoma belcheri]